MLKASIWPDADAEAHEHAERPDAIERRRERRLADAVIDHRAQLAAGDLLDLGDEILVAIENGVVRAVLLGELGLVLRADGADHVGAEMIGPLAGDQADAAGRRMDEDVVALLHLGRSAAAGIARSCP